jgi:hypothetical protein
MPVLFLKACERQPIIALKTKGYWHFSEKSLVLKVFLDLQAWRPHNADLLSVALGVPEPQNPYLYGESNASLGPPGQGRDSGWGKPKSP